MICNWPIWLARIINTIDGKFDSVKITHYSPEKLDERESKILEEIDTVVAGKLLKNKRDRIYNATYFPKNLDLHNVPHIIMDMAHLVSYAITNPQHTYAGYDAELLKNYKYIYLGFDTFSKCIYKNVNLLEDVDRKYFLKDVRENEINALPFFVVNEDKSITTIHEHMREKGILKLYYDYRADMTKMLKKVRYKCTWI